MEGKKTVQMYLPASPALLAHATATPAGEIIQPDLAAKARAHDLFASFTTKLLSRASRRPSPRPSPRPTSPSSSTVCGKKLTLLRGGAREAASGTSWRASVSYFREAVAEKRFPFGHVFYKRAPDLHTFTHARHRLYRLYRSINLDCNSSFVPFIVLSLSLFLLSVVRSVDRVSLGRAR